MGLEDRFVHRIQERIRREHPRALMFKLNDRMTIGIPDLLIFNGGHHFAIEMKAIDHEPKKPDAKAWLPHGFSMSQIITLKDLERNGCIALGIIWSKESDKAYILLPQDLRPDHELKWDRVVHAAYIFDLKNQLTRGSEGTMLALLDHVHGTLTERGSPEPAREAGRESARAEPDTTEGFGGG